MTNREQDGRRQQGGRARATPQRQEWCEANVNKWEAHVGYSTQQAGKRTTTGRVVQGRCRGGQCISSARRLGLHGRQAAPPGTPHRAWCGRPGVIVRCSFVADGTALGDEETRRCAKQMCAGVLRRDEFRRGRRGRRQQAGAALPCTQTARARASRPASLGREQGSAASLAADEARPGRAQAS